MSTITDDNTFFNLVQTLPWRGQNSASTGTQDLSPFFVVPGATIYSPTVATGDQNSYAKLTHGFNTYFKMQGYNLNTKKYEVWYSNGAAQLTPPSGNALTNIQIVLTWIDR